MSKVNIVLFIFVLNVLVSVTAEYFPQGTLHSGLLRAGVMAVAIPLLMLRGVRMTRGGVILVVFLSYLLILVPFSSAPLDTLNTLLKVAISLLMFVISYNYIRGREARRKLASIIPVCLALFIINFGVAQVFGLGKSFYHEAGFKTGGGGVQQTYLISYLVLFVPLLGHYRGTDFTLRKSDTLLMVLALFPLVLIGRRGAILGFLVGLIAYLILTPRKGRLVGVSAVVSVIALATMPLYIGQMTSVFGDRMEGVENPEQMGRSKEIIEGVKMVATEPLAHAVFGSELFNFEAISGDDRSLHTDYATFLIGSGVLGFTLYFGGLVAIWFDFRRRIILLKDTKTKREITGVVLSLFLAFGIISYSGQYYVVSSLSVVFVLLGSAVAFVEEKIEEQSSRESLTGIQAEVLDNRERQPLSAAVSEAQLLSEL